MLLRSVPDVAIVIALLLTAVVAAPAQDPASTSAADGSAGDSLSPDATGGELTADEVQTRLTAIEGEAGLDDVTRNALLKRYQETLDALRTAAEYRVREAEYRRALESGSERVAEDNTEAARLEAAQDESALPSGLDHRAPNDRIQAALLEAQTELANQRNELNDLLDAIRDLESDDSSSPEAISEAGKELRQAESELAALTESPQEAGNRSTEAERARLTARREMLSARSAMQQQADLSREIRTSMAEASRRLLQARITRTEARVAALQDLATTILERKLRESEALLSRLTAEDRQLSEATREQLDLFSDLIIKSRSVESQFAQSEKALELRDAERKRIVEALESTRQLVELGGVEHNLAQMLLEQLRAIPGQREIHRRLAEIETDSLTAQTSRLEVTRLLRRGSPEVESPGSTGERPQGDGTLSESEQRDLDAAREALINHLAGSYHRYLRDLSNLERTERQIESASAEFREFALQKLFWVRSSPPINVSTFTSLDEGIVYGVGTARVGELFSRLGRPPRLPLIGLGAALALLLWLRPRCHRWLQQAAEAARRISTDRFSHTLRALGATAILALPVPLALGAIGAILRYQPDASAWSFGLGTALTGTFQVLPALFLLLAACCRNGLGQIHFGWRDKALVRIRRAVLALVLILLFAEVTLSLVLHEPTGSYIDGLGRLAAIASVIALAITMAFLLHPRRGIAAMIHERAPKSVFGRMRNFWLVPVIAIALGLLVMLTIGFVYGGALLLDLILTNTASIAIAIIAYGLMLRWFSIQQQRMERDAAVKERAARREQARKVRQAGGEVGQQANEEVIIEDERSIDLTAVGEQTRRLLGFVVGMGLLAKLFFDWIQFGPVVGVLGELKPFGDFSLFEIATAILIVAITISATINLPGLLELLVLQRTRLDAGTRNSVTTLGKYLVIAIGATLFFQVIGVDWAQFGWIAAALSVGIGFGLQEVVANFISGIILLFERPVRVGDVVTVDGIDGKVTRIQIRATTITNWDQKEFVVPNKNFITGTVLNWTLSNPINRLLIVVGVAYGTDTEKACRILVEVASAHPKTTEDPAPSATFEEFSDSSLKLVLRCFLPNMDNRLQVLSELHAEIARRFDEAGIEIPFPQRDLNLRSAEATLRIERGAAAAASSSEREP